MLQLLVQRVVGARDKAWLTFDLGYTLPDAYMKREPPRRSAAPPRPASPRNVGARRPPTRDGRHPPPTDDEPLWMQIWRGDVVKIGYDDRRARRSHADLLLPERPGPPPDGLHVGPPRLSAVHSGLARLVRECAAFGRQRPDLRQFAADRLQLGILPVGAADLPALGLDRRGTAVLGPRPVLRLALPVRRAAGIAQQHRQGGEDPAIPACPGGCTSGCGRSSTSSSSACSACRCTRPRLPSNWPRSSPSRPRSS